MIRLLIQWLIALLLFLSYHITRAQSPVQVSGAVINTAGQPVAHATVHISGERQSLTHLSDSTGFFLLTLMPGSYLLTVTAIGMKPFRKEITISKNTILLDAVVLSSDAVTALNTIVIKAEKALIEQQLDRTVVNVGALIGASSGNALQVLEKTPGVTVEGNTIGLNGRGAASILIDNRPTHMSEADLLHYLKSIPAGTVEKIELIPVPPASYQAAGASLINIVLKKNRLPGMSGSLNAGGNAGKYVRGWGNASLYYNRRKLQLTGSLSHNHDNGFSNAHTERHFMDQKGETNTLVTQRHFTRPGFNNVSSRVGIDYDLSSSTSIGAIAQWRGGPGWSSTRYTSENETTNGNELYSGNGYSRQGTFTRHHFYNVHALHKFSENGGQLSVDVNYMQHNKSEDIQLNKITTAHTILSQYFLPGRIRVYNAQADYNWSAKKHWKIETGWRSGNVSTDNIFRVTEQYQDSDVGEHISNRFRYQEWIHAGYLSVQKKIHRFNTKLGIRGEQTDIRGSEPEEVNTETKWFRKSYISFFPSAFVSYSFDTTGRKNMVLSISRRINRPGFQQLNPFLVKEDDYNFSGGNPLLQPQFNTQIDLRYQHHNQWTFNAIYSGFRQIIFSSLRVEDSIFIRQPENIANGIAAGVSVNYQTTVAPWWRINANINLIRLYLRGKTFGNLIREEMYTGRINAFNHFTFSKKWKGEWMIFYRHKDLQGQTANRPRWRMNVAVLYECMAGKAQLRVFADDIFLGWIEKGTTKNLENSVVYFRRIQESRMAGISLSFRFGSKNTKAQHRDTNEEQQRL